MTLKKRKTPLSELYAEKEALRNQPLKKDHRLKDFIETTSKIYKPKYSKK